ncbi:MAG: ATP-binding cassette domain-containing protein [Deltaproteobacteria bacterium]|nr:ATP-binding cassette domain-containing protein [Deltaproteobacteria bacterium]
MKAEPLITLDKIAVRLYDRIYLQNTSWEIKTHENWAIVGPNGSGKTTLAKALFGGVPVVRGSVRHHVKPSKEDSETPEKVSVGYASPELFREVFERELLQESFRDFSGRIDEKTTPRDIVIQGMQKGACEDKDFEHDLRHFAEKLGIGNILNRDICAVSSGELCKVVIVRALMRKPKLLILDEPFNGLDSRSRKDLKENLDDLIRIGVRLVLITHRFEELPSGITHVLQLKDGEIRLAGKKEQVLGSGVFSEETEENGNRSFALHDLPYLSFIEKETTPGVTGTPEDRTLIDMRHVKVRYGDTVVLDDFNWEVKTGENWLILGENGAGKSTVLKLILGDNPQAYSNHVFVFGKKRGVGTSIWETKKKIGMVSTEFQARYPKDVPAFHVVLSGFFDSMGLFRTCSKEQKTKALEWMKMLRIDQLKERTFGSLSYGQRKLTLIARAVVKSPVLLFLDEPCDGLDRDNRKKILGVLENIGRHTHTKLVYVTHHEDEILPCITHRLMLHRGRIIESAKIR